MSRQGLSLLHEYLKFSCVIFHCFSWILKMPKMNVSKTGLIVEIKYNYCQ